MLTIVTSCIPSHPRQLVGIVTQNIIHKEEAADLDRGLIDPTAGGHEPGRTDRIFSARAMPFRMLRGRDIEVPSSADGSANVSVPIGMERPETF
jgi:hypothetical protein